tara:strand:- start:167 stop:496 length:330 start_codon:yes stop_codon:yes gene_type:complete
MAERPFIQEDKITDEEVLRRAKDLCPVQVFDEVGGKIIVARPRECIACHACESPCENEEIKVREATEEEMEVVDTPGKRFGGNGNGVSEENTCSVELPDKEDPESGVNS